MKYTKSLNAYLDYAEKNYHKDDSGNINLYFSSIKNYIYPTIDDINHATLNSCIKKTSYYIASKRNEHKRKYTKQLKSYYIKFKKFALQQNKNNTINQTLILYRTTNTNISNQEYYYIRKLIHLLSKKYINDYPLRNLKKITKEYIKDYLEQFPDDTYEEIKDLIWEILKDYKKFIKRRGGEFLMTITEASQLFLKNISIRLKTVSYDFYEKYLRHISDYIGNLEIEKLTKHDVYHMLDKKKNDNPNISNATLNKYITVTKTMYHFITDKRLPIQKLKEKQTKIPIIESDIINKIFTYYKNNLDDKVQFRNYIYYRLSLETGLRLNEIINIKMENINMQERLIYVTVTKTDVDRFVSFSDETRILLHKFILLFHDGYEYLFINFKTGKRLSKSSIESQTQALKSKLNIKQSISPHKWRHTFATKFITKGGNLTFLQKFLGHTSLKTTQKYLHLTTQDLLDEYNRVFN